MQTFFSRLEEFLNEIQTKEPDRRSPVWSGPGPESVDGRRTEPGRVPWSPDDTNTTSFLHVLPHLPLRQLHVLNVLHRRR